MHGRLDEQVAEGGENFSQFVAYAITIQVSGRVEEAHKDTGSK